MHTYVYLAVPFESTVNIATASLSRFFVCREPLSSLFKKEMVNNVSPSSRAESIWQCFWQPGKPSMEKRHDPLETKQRKDGQVWSFELLKGIFLITVSCTKKHNSFLII